MNIKEEIRGNVAVLSVRGALMSGPDVAPFHEKIKSLIKDGVPNVVADFSAIKWFASPMLGVLTASLVSLRSEGGDLRLAGTAEKIISLMLVTEMNKIFKSFESTDDAVGSFGSDPPAKPESD